MNTVFDCTQAADKDDAQIKSSSSVNIDLGFLHLK